MESTTKISTNRLRRVFVWELPVRIYHWVNALVIVILCVTGYLIGNPPAFISHVEASDQYLFGWIRFLHFAAAYIFLFNFIFRIYWGFVGNKYADWRNFIPTTRKFLKEMWQVIRIDILLKRNTDHMAVGHNPLAGFIYFLTFIAFLVQCITGFALYATMSDWWLADAFYWVSWIFGHDEFALRNWHHATMWFFIIFAMVHVYLVFYHDYVEGRGEISSMGGGWKFIEEEAFYKDEAMHREREIKKQEKRARRKKRSKNKTD
jgi:Ni/Fe-hydrogenase 1 B-type cytochrome subunit